MTRTPRMMNGRRSGVSVIWNPWCKWRRNRVLPRQGRGRGRCTRRDSGRTGGRERCGTGSRMIPAKSSHEFESGGSELMTNSLTQEEDGGVSFGTLRFAETRVSSGSEDLYGHSVVQGRGTVESNGAVVAAIVMLEPGVVFRKRRVIPGTTGGVPDGGVSKFEAFRIFPHEKFKRIVFHCQPPAASNPRSTPRVSARIQPQRTGVIAGSYRMCPTRQGRLSHGNTPRHAAPSRATHRSCQRRTGD